MFVFRNISHYYYYYVLWEWKCVVYPNLRLWQWIVCIWLSCENAFRCNRLFHIVACMHYPNSGKCIRIEMTRIVAWKLNEAKTDNSKREQKLQEWQRIQKNRSDQLRTEWAREREEHCWWFQYPRIFFHLPYVIQGCVCVQTSKTCKYDMRKWKNDFVSVYVFSPCRNENIERGKQSQIIVN